MHPDKRILIIGLVMCLLLPVAFCGLSAGAESENAPAKQPEAWRTLIGSWHVTSAQKSLVISIESEGQALILFIQPGQHSIDRVPWEPFQGGILVQDIPRKRLWPGRNDQELRVEIEALPEVKYDPDQEFHQRFFMKRVNERILPKGWRERPPPANWLQETVEAGWDAAAGRRQVDPKTQK